MTLQQVDMVFQFLVFLFAICVHESAHAWMADRCGDPTAKMLGRITLNPLKHIDPFGTVILPALGMLSGAGFFGWAKPCPVTPDNFREPVRGDILTTAAGPISNFILVVLSFAGLAVIALASGTGKLLVQNITDNAITDTDSLLMPVVWLLHNAIRMNVVLAIFNFIPIPPLDGSHILRHMLPEGARHAYDSMGMIGFLLAMVVGGPILMVLVPPVMHYLNSLLYGMTA